MYHACMTMTSKTKVEVFLVETIRARFDAICEVKGISNAEGLRRAIELWIKKEGKNGADS